MRIIFCYFLLAVLFFACETAIIEPIEGFEKTYGTIGYDYATAAKVVGENIFILGTTNVNGNKDFYLTKINEKGDKLLEKTYGGSGSEEGYNLTSTLDGNLLLLGISNSFGSSYDLLLIKIKQNGDTLWQKNYDNAGAFDIAKGILELTSGEFFILGTLSNGNTNDVRLTKLDAQGNLLWQRSYPTNYNESGLKIIESGDGNYMLLGQQLDGDDDFYLMKVDNLGDVLWTKKYGGADYEEAHSIVRTQDNGFLLCGHSASVDPIHNLYGVKIDATGMVVWEKHFGGVAHDGGTGAMELSHGNLIFVGETDSYGNNKKRMLMVRTTSDGTLLEQTSFGGELNDKATCVVETATAFYMIGESASFGGGGEVFVVKRVK